ncbi:MAG TPA: ribonuclease R [Burkholderiales bacterium]|nr:ribonuclease R [Burkholderiales bacterium]
MSTKKKSLRSQDPYWTREKKTYENPLPSREFILQVLVNEGVPLMEADLAGLLEIDSHELVSFSRRLQAMERDGQVMRNRRGAICLVEKLDLIKGKVQGHPDGFGFLVPEDGSADLYLNPREMQKVFHGDKVMGREVGLDRRGRREGAIVEVLEHTQQKVVGRLFEERGLFFVVAENKRISQDILIAPTDLHDAKPGQVVVAKILLQPSKHAEPMGEIVEVLGNYADPGMEIEIALRKHDLPHEFSADVEKLAKKFPKGVRKTDLKGREDITHLPLVTIDGETARDFDDAVYCEPQGKGFRLLVAIADVSHYVKPKDALDQEALNRGNSVYFPRRVIPMLPEELSNGLCSLNPEVDRLCMVCDMNISANGDIKQYRFYPAVMHSHARLTYTKVAAMLYENDEAMLAEYEEVLPHLKNLDKVFRVLLKSRELRGAIDFDSVETQMVFDEQGKIEKIIPITRNDAHRLIEECMLAANVCSANFLLEHEHKALFRIHEGPTPEKLDNLRAFLKQVGLDLGGGEHPEPKDYAKLRDRMDARPDAALLQTILLRSMQQAVYSPDNVGHFGLAYEAYTHFTSPIRRYPDLLVHRAIKAVLKGEEYSPGNWEEVGFHCSQTERRADEATRDVQSWLKCYYMQDKVGETYRGAISAVVSFGVFVVLDGIFTEGLVHISELGSDYFHFDAARHELVGERTGQRFRLGDRLMVRVTRVDMETSKIDFVLAQAKDLPSADTPMMPSFVPVLTEKSKEGEKKSPKKKKPTS